MNMFQWIKTTFTEVEGDFNSCLNRAIYFISNSSSKSELLFFTSAIIILLFIIFHSNSEAGFYLNLSKILFVSIASFFVFCLSDCFWFLIKKAQLYKLNIRNRKNIASLIKRMHDEKVFDNENNHIEAKILMTAIFNSEGYKYHAKRNAVEICLILLILLFTFPLFFLFNLALFCVMFVYVFLYEQQSVNQVFDDIGSLIFLIDKSYKNNPKECEKFIINNSNQEIRDLRMLYYAVSKPKHIQKELVS